MTKKNVPYVDEDGEFHLCDKWTRALAQEATTRRHPVFSEDLRAFFRRVETYCVKDCYGLDAFGFSASSTTNMNSEAKTRIRILLQEEREEAEQSEVRWFTLWDLNATLLKEEYLVLLNHLESLVNDSTVE